jgi:hypothetical protein
MNKLLLIAVAATLVVSIPSCKKTEAYNPPTPKNTAPSTSEPDDATIFLKAVRFFTSQAGTAGQTNEYQIGDAFGFFRDANAAKVNAGVVTVNTLELTNESNNYVYNTIDNLPNGILFDTDNATWVVTGDTNTGIQPITISDNSPFPAKPVITEKEINTQASYLLVAKDTIIADSTIFVITGPTGTLRKVRGPNARSVAFTKEEMSTLGTGRALGLVQISAFNLVLDTLLVPNTKTYYLKQTIASKYVDLE